MVSQALSDVTVLDLTHYIAGPTCTKLLADYGAEVIKVERPDGGDGARRLGPFPDDAPHPEKSGLFIFLNTNKKGITLNLQTATGRKLFRELVAQADILVENFRPGVMARLGLAYEDLAQINPRLVMTSIANFGQTGPHRDWEATELTLFAAGGYMSFHGAPGRQPLKYPGYKALMYAGTHAAAASLGALWGARLRGVGQQVDVSVQECLLGPAEPAHRLVTYAYDGDPGKRPGHRREGTYPDGIYHCQDGLVLAYGPGLRNWPRLCRLMNRPDLLADPRFADPVARIHHHGEFDAIFASWCLEHKAREVFEAAQRERLTFGVVYTMADLFEDRQYRERGFFVEIAHPEAGTWRYPGAPFQMTATPWRVVQPAPRLGEHNEEVYGQRLDLNREDLVRLRHQGVI